MSLASGRTLLACLCLSCLPSTAQQAEPRVDPEFRQRLELELASIAKIRRALEARPLTVEGLQRELASSSLKEDRELGFGGRLIELVLPCACTGTLLSIFSVNGGEVVGATEAGQESPIVRIEIEQRWDVQRWPKLGAELKGAWGEEALESGTSLRIEREDRELYSACLARIAFWLGKAPEALPDESCAQAYRTLMNPLSKLEVGTGCGIVGLPPRGRAETEALTKAGRFDLLRSILRGPNPESRVYAAHALTNAGALEAADRTAIENLARRPVTIVTCSGCRVRGLEWSAAMQVLEGESRPRAGPRQR